MNSEIASMRIARSIKSVEDGMDELLAKSGELLTEMARARLATENAAVHGQRPLARVAAMQKSLVEARSELVRAHSDLSKLAETMDIAAECPETALLDGNMARARGVV
ncbi:hypothetical protein SAMN05518801_10870 [Novosphingobium sp. CF614]|uniref:hypothetical protein n=1 Tax=Novosphingobium sp. CF614 TaxID=1884364 RepID=UPI0008EAC217|nr:hypothetical protein [Novosphingobium sp. CF614]SFG14382.1 hypothetical protein SAMN05518801_10870 [Novosphingobium sp. CF614]